MVTPEQWRQIDELLEAASSLNRVSNVLEAAMTFFLREHKHSKTTEL